MLDDTLPHDNASMTEYAHSDEAFSKILIELESMKKKHLIARYCREATMLHICASLYIMNNNENGETPY